MCAELPIHLVSHILFFFQKNISSFPSVPSVLEWDSLSEIYRTSVFSRWLAHLLSWSSLPRPPDHNGTQGFDKVRQRNSQKLSQFCLTKKSHYVKTKILKWSAFPTRRKLVFRPAVLTALTRGGLGRVMRSWACREPYDKVARNVGADPEAKQPSRDRGNVDLGGGN